MPSFSVFVGFFGWGGVRVGLGIKNKVSCRGGVGKPDDGEMSVGQVFGWILLFFASHVHGLVIFAAGLVAPGFGMPTCLHYPPKPNLAMVGSPLG